MSILDQEIAAGLATSPYQIEFYSENLEATLFPDNASQHRIRDWYIRKYADRKPDLIITVGPASLEFMVESHETSFPNTPVIFCGTTKEMLDQLEPDSHFTGVWGVAQPEMTLIAALHLQPDTKHVVVVGGVGAFDRSLEAVTQESLRKYESQFEFTYLTNLDMPALLERLRHLPSKTIVYHTAIMEDAAGAHFIDASQSVPMIVDAANAPVFVTDDVDVGRGTVGGYVVSWAADGKVAGAMAVRILDGVKPQQIPVVRNSDVYMFDWRALHRWGFKESDLPPGSVVFYRQLTVWEVYKQYIILGIAVMFAEALLIFGLLWQRKRRRKSELHVRESEERFRLVANTAPVMIWMSGPDKLCNYFNQPWLDFTGRSLEAELGNGWLKGVHPGNLKDCLGTYTRAFDLRESFKMQYRLRRHDGVYRWVLDIGVPRLSLDGSFAGYIGSCIDITDRKLAEEALASVGRRLIEAQEEERTWIARELHDDINQRIALLSMDLEQWAQDPASSEVEVSNHIRNVLQALADLGKDIQALAHRLHSSKLEFLGLAAAAGGFCRELSAQKNMKIDFSHAGIPRNLSKEISLCLFRVLQEALQNAVKHSGARQFRVELHATSGEIQLIVNDQGVGFDQQDAVKRHGLGLVSMQERTHLVGGEFSIKSEPGRGTTISAWVPLEVQKQKTALPAQQMR